MSSDDRHSILPRLRPSQWYILLNGQPKDCLLPRLRSIRVLTNMLTRNGVFYDLKIRRHGESTPERGTYGWFRKRMGSRAGESIFILTRRGPNYVTLDYCEGLAVSIIVWFRSAIML